MNTEVCSSALFDTTLDYSDHDWVDQTVCYISSYLQPKKNKNKYLYSHTNKRSKKGVIFALS